MLVKELIKKLQKLDPEKKVMIKSGNKDNYILANSVTEMDLFDKDLWYEGIEQAVVIQCS